MGAVTFPVAGGGKSQYTIEFTSSGTFTLPSGYGSGNPLTCDVLILGAGGGGGSGSTNNSSGTWSYGGGGGGSGVGVMLRSFPVTSNTTVTIGAAGAGGAAVSGPLQKNTGSDGGASSFGSWSAPGGGGGGGGGGENAPGGNGNTVQYGSGIINRGTYSGYTMAGNAYGGGSGGAGGSPGGNGAQGAASGRGGWGGVNSDRYYIYGTGSTANWIGNGGTQGPQSFGQLQMNANYVWDGTNNQFRFTPNVLQSSDLLPYVPGGGGGGGGGYNTRGCGGFAGTRYVGGDGGAGQSTATTQTGATATDPGCGGGGGGAGVSGSTPYGAAGGSGASGLVRITYWA